MSGTKYNACVRTRTRCSLLGVLFAIGCSPPPSTSGTVHSTFTALSGTNPEIDFSPFDSDPGQLFGGVGTTVDASAVKSPPPGQRRVITVFYGAPTAGQRFDVVAWGALSNGQARLWYEDDLPDQGVLDFNHVYVWVSSGGGTLTVDAGGGGTFKFTVTDGLMQSMGSVSTGTFTINVSGDVQNLRL